MTEEKRAPLILDLKAHGPGVAVVLRPRRGQLKQTFEPAQLQRQLTKHGVAWPLFVESVNDFERWLDFPAHRRSFPDYIESRRALLKQLKAQLKLNARQKPAQPIGYTLVANREPKRSVLRPTKSSQALNRAWKTVTAAARKNKTVRADKVRDMLLNMSKQLQGMK